MQLGTSLECSQIVQWLYSQRVSLEISNPGQYFGISLRVYSLARLSVCFLLCVEVLEDRKGCCCFVVLGSEESKHTHTNKQKLNDFKEVHRDHSLVVAVTGQL